MISASKAEKSFYYQLNPVSTLPYLKQSVTDFCLLQGSARQLRPTLEVVIKDERQDRNVLSAQL
ncbi:hypothetical protein T265_16325, partial [Opisthorchis viverrini]